MLADNNVRSVREGEGRSRGFSIVAIYKQGTDMLKYLFVCVCGYVCVGVCMCIYFVCGKGLPAKA